MRPILETSRFQLREMTPHDLDFVAEMLGDPDVMRFYPQTYDRTESATWLDHQRWRYAEHGHGLWLVIDRRTGEPVGQVGLLEQDLSDGTESEIGYLIHRHHWRRGYATEAALGVRAYAFDTLARERVISLIRPVNVSSKGVARKLGMTPEREVEFHGLRHLVFSVSRDAVRMATTGLHR